MSDAVLPLTGIRVLEVASWVFVPSACAVLAEWGADVIKIENPAGGDPQRGLVSSGFVPSADEVNHLFEVPNRGKRSVAIDLKHPDGRQLALDLARTCDVMATNLLPKQRESLGLDVADVRTVNPRVVYAIGSGTGEQGPDAGKGGFDLSTYWARQLAHAATPADADYPLNMPAAGFGDLNGGLALAGGVALALLQRERTGRSIVVDNSLIGMAAWASAMNIVGAATSGREARPQWEHAEAPNALVNYYRTADGKFIHLSLMQADRWWPDLVRALDRPDLVDDPVWMDRPRGAPAPDVVAVLDEIFASRTLDQWSASLSALTGGAVWEQVRSPAEVASDPQLREIGVLREIGAPGHRFPVVACPVQIADSASASEMSAPELGQHTEEVLLELGLTIDEIIELKVKGALL